MDRTGWQQLAETRVSDAKVLLAGGRWACAYYVAGYAIECALKSCVLRYVHESGIIFDDPKFLAGCRTHDLDTLVALANLQASFGAVRGVNSRLDIFWGLTIEWTEESRYQANTQKKAEELYKAITNDPDGVLQWIRTHW